MSEFQVIHGWRIGKRVEITRRSSPGYGKVGAVALLGTEGGRRYAEVALDPPVGVLSFHTREWLEDLEGIPG